MRTSRAPPSHATTRRARACRCRTGSRGSAAESTEARSAWHRTARSRSPPTAQNIQKTSTTTPKMNPGRRSSSRTRSLRAWRRSERSIGPRRVRLADEIGHRFAGRSLDARRGGRRRSGGGTFIDIASPRRRRPRPWVHPGQDQVGGECGQHVDDADDEHTGDQHREVLGRGVGDQVAESGVVEDPLDHDQAAEHVAHLDADHGDRRLQAVAQHVVADHLVGRAAPSSSPFGCSRRRGRAITPARVMRAM